MRRSIVITAADWRHDIGFEIASIRETLAVASVITLQRRLVKKLFVRKVFGVTASLAFARLIPYTAQLGDDDLSSRTSKGLDETFNAYFSRSIRAGAFAQKKGRPQGAWQYG
jgi:hypothetical protein